MTNSEALKELLVAVGGAEPEGAQTNLELLNAISEQLGGDADAESNAAAIHNIAQNASGGGGKTTKIKVKNNINSVISVGSLEVVDGNLQQKRIVIQQNESVEINHSYIDVSSVAVIALPEVIVVSDASMSTGTRTYSVNGTNCNASVFASKTGSLGYDVIIQISITPAQAATGEAEIAISRS